MKSSSSASYGQTLHRHHCSRSRNFLFHNDGWNGNLPTDDRDAVVVYEPAADARSHPRTQLREGDEAVLDSSASGHPANAPSLALAPLERSRPQAIHPL